MGGTAAWKICGLDPSTTLAVAFEVSNQVMHQLCVFYEVSRKRHGKQHNETSFSFPIL